jgi:hypothetical protein
MTNFQNPTDADYQSYREYLIAEVDTEELARQEATLRDYQNSNGYPGIDDSRLSPLASQHYHRMRQDFTGICGITGINYFLWEVAENGHFTV